MAGNAPMTDLLAVASVAPCLLLVVTTLAMWLGSRGARLGLRLAYAAFPASQLACAGTIFVWANALALPSEMVLVASVAAACCCPVDVVLFRRLKQAQEKELSEMREAMLARQLDLTKSYNAELALDMERVRGIREKAQAEIEGIAKLLDQGRCDPEDASRALNGIRHVIGDTALRLCDNQVVDIVAQAKCKEGADAGIDVEVVLDVPRDVKGVSDVELTAVFGNLLDNGIAAALAAKEASDACDLSASNGSRPFVSLASEVRGSILAITVSNSIASKAAAHAPENSSSSDRLRDHGWGLSIVEAIAKRHAGVLSTERCEGVFKTTVLLMMEGA